MAGSPVEDPVKKWLELPVGSSASRSSTAPFGVPCGETVASGARGSMEEEKGEPGHPLEATGGGGAQCSSSNRCNSGYCCCFGCFFDLPAAEAPWFARD